MSTKISEVAIIFQQAAIEEIPNLIEEYQIDSRAGVVAICHKAKKALEALEKEKQRTQIMKYYENQYEISVV